MCNTISEFTRKGYKKKEFQLITFSQGEASDSYSGIV